MLLDEKNFSFPYRESNPGRLGENQESSLLDHMGRHHKNISSKQSTFIFTKALCTGGSIIIQIFQNEIFTNYFICYTFSSYIYLLITVTFPLFVIHIYPLVFCGSLSCNPIWSSGQDSWFSPRRPRFDSRYGNTLFKCTNFAGAFINFYQAMRLKVLL